jgi:acyl carrier protein
MVLADVFAKVFDEPPETFTDDSSQDTVVAWTSLRHVTLLVTVEDTYKVRFSNAELATLRSMGDIRTALTRHGAQVA